MVPPKEQQSRVAADYSKRFVYALANMITIIVTGIYLSHAVTHYNVIQSHTSVLKTPFGQFDLQNSRIGWAFAIGRVVFLSLTTFFSIAVPEACIFIFSVFALLFEIPMALVAESSYGYLVSFAQLDLSPPDVSCAAVNMTIPQWDFYTSYANIVGKQPYDICKEFVHEGSLLRASLLFSWFSLWIPFFLIALFCALCNGKDATRWDLIIHFVGFEVGGLWSSFKGCFKMPRWSMPRLRRSKSQNGSESSTLADEKIEITACKV